MQPINVKCRKLKAFQDFPLPNKVLPHRGLDLRLAISRDKTLCLLAGEIQTVPTGVQVFIPPKYQGEIKPRNDLIQLYGLLTLPISIPNLSRGEIRVTLWNTSKQKIILKRGDIIARLSVLPIPGFNIEEVHEWET